MYTARFVLCLFVALCASLSPLSQEALASEESQNTPSLPYIIMHDEGKAKKETANFTVTPPKNKTLPPLDVVYASAPMPIYGDGQRNFNASSQNKEGWEDEILDKIPHGDHMKYMWNLIDGDVDLYFTDLRFDRRNKGVSYETKTIPLIGEVEDIKFKFEAGEDQKVSFKSRGLPIIGGLDRINFKGATGNNGSQISARYTISLDSF